MHEFNPPRRGERRSRDRVPESEEQPFNHVAVLVRLGAVDLVIPQARSS